MPAKRQMRLRLWPWLRLAKPGICLMITVAALFGALLAEPDISLRTFLLGAAVLLLAAGAATLNSLQEDRLDSRMRRTSSRPLPQRELSRRQALYQALFLLGLGMALLTALAGRPAASLGGLAVFLYNGLYTPLKGRTVLAIVPGALSGALPPLIGWVGMGGTLFSYPAALLAALLVLWQIPHSWLVLLSHRHDFHDNKLPNILEMFGETRVKAFFLPWLVALATVMFLQLNLFDLPLRGWPIGGVAANVIVLLLVFARQLPLVADGSRCRSLFATLNLSLLVHMALIGANRLFA